MGDRAERAAAASTPTPPKLTEQDEGALRSFLEAMIAAGAVGALVSWLLGFIGKLWKTQNELADRLRRHRRAQPPSEKLKGLLWLPGVKWDEIANDNNVKPPRQKPKVDRRTRGNNPKRDKHGRPELPAELPRREKKLFVPDAERICQHCNVEMTRAEWIPREVLERVPATYFVWLYLRERLQCPCCQSKGPVAPTPDTVVDKGLLGTDLIVDALVDHVQDGVPFERMAREARAQGVPLAANTLARSVGAAVDLLDPVVGHIFERCVTSDVVGMDATSMPVQDREVPRGLRIATLWNLLGDRRWSYFGYAETGHAARLAELVKGCAFHVVQCDASHTLNVVEEQCEARAGCHAHGRRRLVAAIKINDLRALPGVLLYAELFAVEATSKALKETADQRLVRRLAESQPILKRLWSWVDEQSPRVEPKSTLGEALTYLRNQREPLQYFLTDGRVELTNNDVEREIRTYVLDRKTWLFNGSEASAKRTAAALTVVRTCLLLKVDVRAYLRFVLRRILDGEKDAASLWPENFANRLKVAEK